MMVRPPALSSNDIRLRDGDTVAVTGGGPSGAFFAIRLLRAAQRAGLHLAVTIIEKKSASRGADAAVCELPGCNFCAGGAAIYRNNGDGVRDLVAIITGDDSGLGRFVAVLPGIGWPRLRLPSPRDL